MLLRPSPTKANIKREPTDSNAIPGSSPRAGSSSGPGPGPSPDQKQAGGDNPQPDDDHLLLSDPEDYLEENESLDMNLSNGLQKIWQVKLPRYLMEKWLDIDRVGGSRLGTVKIRKHPVTGKLQVKLVLNEQSPSFTTDIPKEYDMSILNTQVRNSYVFSEENLAKFKQELTEVAAMPDQPQLPGLPSDVKRRGPGAPDPQKQVQRYYRVQKNSDGLIADPSARKYIPYIKTIPKKTNLVGKVVHDCQIIPSKGDSKYALVMTKRLRMSADPVRPKVTLLTEIPGVIQLNAGPSIKGNNTLVFLKLSNVKPRLLDGRAIRMPQKDLFDLLFRLFEEYEYWLMKGLKERTRQPELYLKELLEQIANLIKKGPYTSKYNLKPEYRRLRDAERAARLGLEQEEAVNEEEEDEEMEDVV